MRCRRFLLPRLWICHYLLHFHFVFSLCNITLFYHFVFHHFVPSFLLSLWILSLCILSLWATSAGSKLLFTEKQKKQTIFTQYNMFSIWRKIFHENYGLWNYWTLLLTEPPVEIVFTDELKNINYWLTHWLTKWQLEIKIC